MYHIKSKTFRNALFPNSIIPLIIEIFHVAKLSSLENYPFLGLPMQKSGDPSLLR